MMASRNQNDSATSAQGQMKLEWWGYQKVEKDLR